MSETALPAEVIEAVPRLSVADAEELLSRVASLAKLRGDLPSGLRTSAASCDSAALAQALRRVADQVEQGRSPHAVLADAEWGLPPHLAGLVAAAMTTGDCGLVLSEIVSLRESIDDAWRETRSAMAYPLVLVLVTAAVLVFLLNYVVPQLVEFYAAFELPFMPVSTEALLWFASTGQWLVAAWLAAIAVLAVGVRLIAPWSLYCRARSSLPVFGKIFLWTGVVELLRLVRLLVQHGIPLADAWRLAAMGVRDGHLANVADRVARACELGTPLAKALGDEAATFPPTIVPLIRVAEKAGDLPGSLDSAAELVLHRIEARARLIRTLAPPIMFLAIASFAVSVPVALVIVPVFSLMQMIGGNLRGGPPGAPLTSWLSDLHSANFVMLLPLAIALSFSRRMIYGDRRIGESSWLESTLRLVEVLCWTLAAFGYLFFALTPFSLLLLIATAYVIVVSYFAYYGSERDALLAALSFSARRFVPLSDSAWSRYVERGDRLGRKCILLAEALAGGATLPVALRSAWIRLPGPQRIAVESADAAGDFGQTLAVALERQTAVDREVAPVAAKFAYCALTVAVMTMVLTFIMLRIVPVFARMFEEFDLPLPDATVQLVNISEEVVLHVGSIMWLLIVGTIVMGITFNDHIFRLFAFFFPLLHWFRMRQYGAWLMRGLATLARRHQPIVPAIRVLAERYPIFTVGKVLQLAAGRIERGESWTHVLAQYRFLSPYDAAFLAAAERNGHLAWALDEAADNIERRRVLRLRYWSNLFFPLAIVILGGVTAYVFIALFMPLIALIQGMSGRR